MKSITIHNIDDKLATLIKRLSKEKGMSQNKFIQSLLKKALGIEKEKQKKFDLSEFADAWTEDDYNEFIKNTKNLDSINKLDWK